MKLKIHSTLQFKGESNSTFILILLYRRVNSWATSPSPSQSVKPKARFMICNLWWYSLWLIGLNSVCSICSFPVTDIPYDLSYLLNLSRRESQSNQRVKPEPFHESQWAALPLLLSLLLIKEGSFTPVCFYSFFSNERFIRLSLILYVITWPLPMDSFPSVFVFSPSPIWPGPIYLMNERRQWVKPTGEWRRKMNETEPIPLIVTVKE